ncbi:hypothetical protein EGH21_18640 [Halomicroarcula sp. F13]|jgi:uncharacterized C2H2 Zn-finger protein|uniref:C2H2-type domain-containing protein n=3 Tax=Haloarcula TaxID=2237 RepID=A0AAE4F0U6_9EURY|nr:MULTISPECIES: hypothetical protein [Haloarculaceae]MBX0325050.1 hypothetical protein [Halomicroarcula rubra]MDS0223691.1 hypothetical protein [Haloarcula terrestris]MDS0284351.1 hypothetical protein [Halomicroarcula sp. S3CR25-11]
MTSEATLGEFKVEESSGESRSPSLEERLLTPISPSVGLRLIPGRGDSLYLQNRGTERYLFRDEHDRWFVLQPSAKDSETAFVRWVYLPNDKPERLARAALRRRTVVGYDYVRRGAAPTPVRSTVTAMFVAERWPETTYECGSCEALFDSARNHALHCWNAHPWVPNPEQVRRRRRADE